MVAHNAGDGGGGVELRRSSRRRGGRRGRSDAPSTGRQAPLSLSQTWPGGCALDWLERDRVSRAALERCSQQTAAAAAAASSRGQDGRLTRCATPLALWLELRFRSDLLWTCLSS